MFKELNNKILKQASHLNYTVSDLAPSTALELFNNSTLKVWSGASDNTIWDSPEVNHAFRALHDALHLQTGLGFTIDEEITLGRIQASNYDGLLADIIYIEVSKQAEYFKLHAVYVPDQKTFTLNELGMKG